MIEMIVSLVVLGILAVVTIPMLQMPVTAYLDTQRRVELQAQMDLVRNKLAEDLRMAVPNSIRVTSVGTTWYLEYLEMRAVGRYRVAGTETGGPYCPNATPAIPACNTKNDEFSASPCQEQCFTTLGPVTPTVPNVNPAAGDYVVVNPLDATVAVLGNPYLNGAATELKGRITAFSHNAAQNVDVFTMTAHPFPMGSSSGRFYVAAQPVSYVCSITPAAATGTGSLTRYWGYAIAPAQPTAGLAAAPGSALLSNRVAPIGNNCRITYTPTGGSGYGGIVTLRLALSYTTGNTISERIEGVLEFPVRQP